MDFTSRVGERPTQAHINYKCPCGCVAGLTYDRQHGSEHLGMCCCGRLLWVGDDAAEVVQASFKAGQEYEVDEGLVTLPWGGSSSVALAVPLSALAEEKAKRDAGKVPSKVVDPVCGMMFDPEIAAAESTYRGTTYYFCADSCKAMFDGNPAKYAPSRSFFDRLLRRI